MQQRDARLSSLGPDMGIQLGKQHLGGDWNDWAALNRVKTTLTPLETAPRQN
jgi:hypothetical protein